MKKPHKAKRKKKKKAALASVKKGNSNFADPTKLSSTSISDQSKVLGIIFSVFLLAWILKQPDNQKTVNSRPMPPQLGEFALYMILSKKDREYLIGDLEEEFITVQAKFGTEKARIWYYKQVLTSVWPLIRKAIRFGLLAWIEEWVRRRI